jgi:hypothetical protein
MKFGQSSSEFVAMFAVVMVIIVVVVTVIGFTPTETSGAAAGTQSKQYYSGVMRPFNIPDYTQSGDTVTMKLKNMEPQSLYILNITVGNVSKSYQPDGLMFKGGYDRTISIPGLRNCTNIYNFYEYAVSIEYMDSTGVSNTQFSSKQLVGECHIQ